MNPGPESSLKVLVLAASRSAESLNRKLAELAARVAEQHGATVDRASMHDFDVPLYDGDLEKARAFRAERKRSSAACSTATPSSFRRPSTTARCRA